MQGGVITYAKMHYLKLIFIETFGHTCLSLLFRLSNLKLLLSEKEKMYGSEGRRSRKQNVRVEKRENNKNSI